MFSHEEIQSLNELEMTVYDYIMKNRQKIAYMKIRDLADEAHVSTTTVLRLCKKLNCEGYSEFRIKFKQYLLRSADPEQGRRTEIDLSALQDFLHRLETPEYRAGIEAVVKALLQAEDILFVGVGSSGMLAKYGARYFSNVGCYSQCIDDPFTPIGPGNGKKTAVIALSVSGETIQLLDMVSSLKERGSTIISITNSAGCTLARMSDYNLNYYLPEYKAQTYFQITSQVPVTCILEILGRRLYRLEERLS